MEIAVTHHLDEGDGFRYEYDIYTFIEGDVRLIARAYVDTPDDAAFLRMEVGPTVHRLIEEDLRAGLGREAVAYLRGLGKRRIRYLPGSRRTGYVDVKAP